MERRTGIERRVMNVPNWRPLPFSSMAGIDETVRPAAAERRSGNERRMQVSAPAPRGEAVRP